MRKKWLPLILACVLLVSLFFSQVGGAETAAVKPEFTGKVTVLMYDWVNEDGFDPTTLVEVKGYAPYLQEFRDLYPNIELDFQNTDQASIRTKSAAMLATGEVDVTYVMYAPEYAEKLDPYIERDKDQLTDLACTMHQLYTGWDTVDTISMPLKAKVFANYYDKKIFDDWGVEYLSPNASWDEIMEKAKLMTGINPVTGVQNYGFWSALGGDPQDIFANYMSRVTWNHIPFEITGDSMTDLKYNFTDDPAWADAVNWYKEMVPYMDPGCFEYLGYEKMGSQENDLAIMQISWTDGIIKQAVAGGTAKVPGQENRIGFVDMPRNPDGKFQMYLAGSVGPGMANNSKNKDAAWEFMKWMCTSTQLGEYLYESIGLIPVNYTVLEKTGFAADFPDLAAIMNAQPNDFILTLHPPDGAYECVDKYTVLYWQDKMSYEEATQTMQDEMQAIIDAL